jgi:rhodanese-related sulfurtransferase
MAVKNIGAREMKELLKNRADIEIIDVREQDEYDIIRIKDSKLIPMSQIQQRMNEIDWSKEVIFICRSGSRSGVVANFLHDNEKNISNLRSGIYECYRDGNCDLEISEDNIGFYF